MNLDTYKALALGEKVLKDIGFWGADLENPKALFFENGDSTLAGPNIPAWMVCWDYGAEDFGPGNAMVAVAINNQTGRATNVTYRVRTNRLRYDAEADKYFKME